MVLENSTEIEAADHLDPRMSHARNSIARLFDLGRNETVGKIVSIIHQGEIEANHSALDRKQENLALAIVRTLKLLDNGFFIVVFYPAVIEHRLNGLAKARHHYRADGKIPPKCALGALL